MSSRMPLYIDKAVQQALIDYAHKHRVSTLYAAHCNLCKSLHSEGFLNNDDYERLIQQYSSPLTKEAQAKPQSPEQLKQQQIIDEKDRLFRGVAEQWQLDHRPQMKDGKQVSWKEYWLMEAEKWQDKCPAAKALIEAYAGRVFVK